MKVSIIVPVYNGGAAFRRCLGRILAAQPPADEVIVVDDASTDDSARVAEEYRVRLIRRDTKGGPAAARNDGARAASGDVLFFVDADVGIHPDAVGRVREVLGNELDVAAVFGSYDDEPSEKNFLSQYKNLFHHFIHQTSATEVSTFWAGCGAIRKTAFEAMGGFDAQRYPQPSIEDIELGQRLRRAGYRIRLDPQLQGKHFKRWGVRSLWRADFFQRALPWSQLILERGWFQPDLNLQLRHRVSVALVWLLPVALVITRLSPWLWLGVSTTMSALVLINGDVYAFFSRKRGVGFMLRAIICHWLYYGYCGLAYAWKWLEFQQRRFHPARP
ncbi:MAG: glycosyltransferase family 2 protein, partial [Verrucomicrobiae bacterium]|nr:glycosyltransferase family 2 protein [Verrucomicrobiae bacterium]